MTLNYVPHDGYTLDGYIAEAPGLFEAVRFTYRPMSYQQRAVIQGAIAESPPRKSSRLVAEAVAEFIKSWDIRKASDNGEASDSFLDLTPANALRLQPRLVDRLYWIIAGSEASDVDPTRVESSSEDDGTTLQAVLTGSTPGDVRTERDEKN